MIRLVKDGEFESPQEAAWLFCAGELPIDRARELADHWIEQGLETEALIGFEVDCVAADKPLAWWWLKLSFERVLVSLGANLPGEGAAYCKITVRQLDRYISGEIPRSEFVQFLDHFWFAHDYAFPGDFEKFARETGIYDAWDVSIGYSYYEPDAYPPGFEVGVDARFDEAVRRAHERIRALRFTV